MSKWAKTRNARRAKRRWWIEETTTWLRVALCALTFPFGHHYEYTPSGQRCANCDRPYPLNY